METIIHNTFFNPDIIAGFIFLIMGLFINKYPPKSRKTIYGYRTIMSLRTDETWKEANHYAAYLSRKIAVYLIAIGLFCGIVFKNQSQLFFMITCGCVIVAAMILFGTTEWHLSQYFDEDGLARKDEKTNAEHRRDTPGL